MNPGEGRSSTEPLPDETENQRSVIVPETAILWIPLSVRAESPPVSKMLLYQVSLHECVRARRQGCPVHDGWRNANTSSQQVLVVRKSRSQARAIHLDILFSLTPTFVKAGCARSGICLATFTVDGARVPGSSSNHQGRKKRGPLVRPCLALLPPCLPLRVSAEVPCFTACRGPMWDKTGLKVAA